MHQPSRNARRGLPPLSNHETAAGTYTSGRDLTARGSEGDRSRWGFDMSRGLTNCRPGRRPSRCQDVSNARSRGREVRRLPDVVADADLFAEPVTARFQYRRSKRPSPRTAASASHSSSSRSTSASSTCHRPTIRSRMRRRPSSNLSWGVQGPHQARIGGRLVGRLARPAPCRWPRW